jgi:hypothetical protein
MLPPQALRLPSHSRCSFLNVTSIPSASGPVKISVDFFHAVVIRESSAESSADAQIAFSVDEEALRQSNDCPAARSQRRLKQVTKTRRAVFTAGPACSSKPSLAGAAFALAPELFSSQRRRNKSSLRRIVRLGLPSTESDISRPLSR